jgi:hypothetical protein
MKPPLAIVLTILVSGSLAAEPDIAAEATHAREAVAAFGKALRGELMAAMQSGGPVAAIAACNEKAPGIAASVSAQNELQISRVSLKNRNPGNLPNDWQTEVLLSFEARIQAGESATALHWQEVADVDGGREFRFMQAIPTASQCLQCHGESLAPPVAEKLAELYPEDQATGFSEGDLRGAFVVTKRL